jgi:hypothetical protein
MKTLKLSIFAAILAIGLYGCVGKDGAPGAQGPQGPQGNALVLSDTFSVHTGNWVVASTSLVASFTATAINTAVYNGGAVEAYYGSYTSLSWTALPWTYPLGGGVMQSLTYSYDNTQGFFLQLDNSNGTTPTAPGSFVCKLVVIPPAIMKAHPNTNWKNYSEVKQILNLRD